MFGTERPILWQIWLSRPTLPLFLISFRKNIKRKSDRSRKLVSDTTEALLRTCENSRQFGGLHADKTTYFLKTLVNFAENVFGFQVSLE